MKKSKDVYPFIIDCSLDKKGNILIFELQPLLDSGLGTPTTRHRPAFEKAFPGFSFTLDYESIQKVFSSDKLHKKILISDKFPYGNQGQNFNDYSYVHVPKKSLTKQLNNKINQRLYLPSEVSPQYVLFDLSKDSDKELARVVSYFNELKIEKIVLKDPEECMGYGNVFIDSIQNERAIKQGIEKLRKNASVNFPYLLVESQSAFPRISRKTGEVKSDFATYRIVGIANENGNLGYFIASKSISSGVDSHQRNNFKFYFNGEKRVDPSQTDCIIQHCKPKNKYFNLGTDRIPIDSKLLDKVFKSAYRLYHDLQMMTPREFNVHIDSLILIKNENRDLNKIEELNIKSLYESFISQFEILNLKDKITVKGTIKQDKLNIYVLTPQPKLPLEISLFLEKIVLKSKDITTEKYSSPRYFFFPSLNGERSSYIKITLPNSLSSYQILIETLKDTKTEITKQLAPGETGVDLSHKL